MWDMCSWCSPPVYILCTCVLTRMQSSGHAIVALLCVRAWKATAPVLACDLRVKALVRVALLVFV